MCFNTIGSYQCAPYLFDGTLRSASPSRIHDISNGVEVEDNDGGQQVSVIFHNNIGFQTLIRWQSITFIDFICINETRIPTGNNMTLICTLPAAAGRRYHPVLHVCLNNDGRCGITQPSSTANVLNYPPFTFMASSFRFGGESSSLGRTELITGTSEPFNLTFDLMNMGPRLQVKVPWNVRYGPSWLPFQYGCVVITSLINGSSVTCTTQESYGIALKVTVSLDDQSLTSTDYMTYPSVQSPGVVSVIGCVGQDGTMTTNCPTTGGIPLTIEATESVIEPLQVLVGSAQCRQPHAKNRTITCTLPAGAGWQSISILLLGNSAGIPSRLVSYAGPTIDSISSESCTNGTNVVNCTRTGNSTLTIMGRNFGASLASVFIGTTRCENTKHDAQHPHSILYVRTPPGIEEELSVLVLQDGGSISTTEVYLSYASCLPGHETDPAVIVSSTNPACRPCPLGHASSDGRACIVCPSRQVAPLDGQSSCITCPDPLITVSFPLRPFTSCCCFD
jgi:hypothetical protein